jgi:hypothetical protein
VRLERYIEFELILIAVISYFDSGINIPIGNSRIGGYPDAPPVRIAAAKIIDLSGLVPVRGLLPRGGHAQIPCR